jgi:hypothetical protein
LDRHHTPLSAAISSDRQCDCLEMARIMGRKAEERKARRKTR